MPLRVVQLTDCHLFADPQAELKGVVVRETFERVLAAVESDFADADRLILTGDLTHDEQPATYQFLRDRLASWPGRLRVLPGNHDRRDVMRDVFGERIVPLYERNVFMDDVAEWRLIGLDSQVPGSLHGELGEAQRGWLRERLSERPARPTCLFLHHPPVDVQSPWLDRIRLFDAESLLELTRSFSQVRAVVCGHVHQEFESAVGAVTVQATPSTGVQFRPRRETLEVDTAPPGFRVFEFHSDGTFVTRVERLHLALPDDAP
jgi:Icc protein